MVLCTPILLKERKKAGLNNIYIYLSSRPGLVFNAISNKFYTLCSISIYMKAKKMPAFDNAIREYYSYSS